MKPWPHTTITFVSAGEAPGHVTRSVLVNGSPVAVEEGGVDISQPASNDVQRVTLTLMPDRVHFIGPDGDAPASTETTHNGDLSDDGAGRVPTDPPAREGASQSDSDEALAALIEPLLPAMPDQASSLLSLKIARAALEHIKRNRPVDATPLLEREREEQRARAEKAEAERDALRERLDALRADVERFSAGDPLITPLDVLDRDDARDPQADPDTVTLPREVVFDLLHEWEADPGVQVHSRVGEVSGIVRAALGWGDSDDA